MYNQKRKLFSQNFLHSPKLVEKLVSDSSITNEDQVVEIGPGRGIITEQLVSRAKHVIAVEIDSEWFNFLTQKFSGNNAIEILNKDFFYYSLPTEPYKVFANIPFSVEGELVRKLLGDEHPPEDTYLVIMKELAYRLSGTNKENMFSTMHKPWFEFQILHHFSRTDFKPVTSVDAVLFRFRKIDNPKLSWEERKNYQKFIETAYMNGLPIMRNLKQKYMEETIVHAFQKTSISRKAKPGELKLEQWISLYKILSN